MRLLNKSTKTTSKNIKKIVELVRKIGSEFIDDAETFIANIDKTDFYETDNDLSALVEEYVKAHIPRTGNVSVFDYIELFELIKQIEEKENGEEFFGALNASENGSIDTDIIISRAERFLEHGELPIKRS